MKFFSCHSYSSHFDPDPFKIFYIYFLAKFQCIINIFQSTSLLQEEEEESPQSNGTKPDFPTPAAKEYILRTTVSRPAPWSRPTPQRMFCVLLKDDFRLAGAFSSDTTFQ